MRIALRLFVLGGMFAPALLAAQEKLPPIQPEDPQLGRAVDFERDIYPLLDNNCVACHNVAITESKLVVEDVASILKGGKRGPSVVPGKPDESLLYLVASRNKEPHMPPLPNDVEAAAFSPKQLGILKQWILEGAEQGAGAGKAALVWQKVPETIQSSFAVDVTRNGRFAAIGRANRISIYDLITRQEVAALHDPLLAGIQLDGKPMYGPRDAHQDFVHALAFDPSGNTLASGGYRGIKLWQRPENVRNWQQTLSGEINAVAVDAERRRAALGTSDHKIVIVNLAEGAVEREIAAHQGPVTGVAFSADGAQIFSSSTDKTLGAWNVADGAKAGEIIAPSEALAIALNKDGNRIVSGHQDNKARVYELPGVAKPADGETEIKPLMELNGHGQPVTTVLSFPTDGNQIVTASADGTVRVWRLDNGQNARSITHGAAVHDAAISADANWIASAGADGFVRIWQTANGQKKTEVRGQVRVQEAALELDLKFSVAKQRAANADARVKEEEKGVAERQEGLKKAQEAQVAADKALAEAQEKLKPVEEAFNTAKAEFDAKTDDKDLEKKFKDAETALNKEKDNVKKAEEGKKVADNSARLSDQSLKNAEQTLAASKQRLEAEQKGQTDAETAQKAGAEAVNTAAKPMLAVAFAPDGKTFVTGNDEGILNAWDVETGKGLDTFTGLAAPARDLAFADASHLISGSNDKVVSLWDLNPAWTIVGRLGPPADKPLELTESLCEDRVVALAFSHDGTKLVSGGGEPSRNGELIVWDVAGKSLIRKIENAHSDTVLGVEFSFDDKFIVSGAADKFAKLFSVESGELVRAFEGHTHHVMDVSIKADGSEIATAGADNAIKIWNIETGEQKRTISNYSKQVTSIAYYGDQAQVVSCSGDKNARVHNTTNGGATKNFGGATAYLYSVATTRDLAIVVASGADGILRVWNGANNQLIHSFEPPAPAAQQATAQ